MLGSLAMCLGAVGSVDRQQCCSLVGGRRDKDVEAGGEGNEGHVSLARDSAEKPPKTTE